MAIAVRLRLFPRPDVALLDAFIEAARLVEFALGPFVLFSVAASAPDATRLGALAHKRHVARAIVPAIPREPASPARSLVYADDRLDADAGRGLVSPVFRRVLLEFSRADQRNAPQKRFAPSDIERILLVGTRAPARRPIFVPAARFCDGGRFCGFEPTEIATPAQIAPLTAFTAYPAFKESEFKLPALFYRNLNYFKPYTLKSNAEI